MVAKHFPHRTVYRAMDRLYRYTDLIFSRYIRHSGSSIVKSANDEAEVAVVVIGACARGVSIDTGPQGSTPPPPLLPYLDNKLGRFGREVRRVYGLLLVRDVDAMHLLNPYVQDPSDLA